MVSPKPRGWHHASRKYSLAVCDIASGKSLFSTDGSSLVYSPDGRWLATLAADEKTVLLVDARTHEVTGRFSGHENSVFKAAFSPDSHRLASCRLATRRDATLLPCDPRPNSWSSRCG
jgi:WD40 repeat protein